MFWEVSAIAIVAVVLLLLFSYYTVCRVVREKDFIRDYSSKYLYLTAILYTISVCNVLLVPLNVNLIVDTSTNTTNQEFVAFSFKQNKNITGNKQVFLTWQVLESVSLILCTLCLPFFILWDYLRNDSRDESNDESDNSHSLVSRGLWSLSWTLLIFCFICLFIVLMWWMFGEIITPKLNKEEQVEHLTDMLHAQKREQHQQYQQQEQQQQQQQWRATSNEYWQEQHFSFLQDACVHTNIKVKERSKASLFTFYVGLVSIVGWTILIVWGGVGLVYKPWSDIALIRRVCVRLSQENYMFAKAEIHDKSALLLEQGQVLLRRNTANTLHTCSKYSFLLNRNNTDRSWREQMEFIEQVSELNEQLAKLEMTYASSQNSPILRTVQALLHFLTDISLSSIWLIYLAMHNIFHTHNFLDTTLSALHSLFPPFEVALYVILSIYIFLCLIHCHDLFRQFLHSFTALLTLLELYEVHDVSITMIVSTALLCLIASHGLMHLAVQSFSQYTAGTIIKETYMDGVEDLQGCSFIFKYASCTLFYVSCAALLIAVTYRCYLYIRKHMSYHTIS